MNEVLRRIGELGLVPVVKIENPDDAVPLGRALLDGDLPVAEITFRTAAAEEAIKKLTRDAPDLLVGAGTVLTVEHAKKAVAAGAQFIVSPGFNAHVVDYCVDNAIVCTPGVNSPTQVETALERGLEVVKFFPAEATGGLPFLKSVAAVYSGIDFIPTGGINEANLVSWLSYDRIHAVGGSWMVKADLISAGRFDEITRLVREAVALMLGFEVAHVGIHEDDEDGAHRSAERLSQLFFFPLREEERCVYAGAGCEIMKVPASDRLGHIAIATNSIERAVAYLRRKGVTVRPETENRRDGKLTSVYLDEMVSGFALHLLQK
jgi:2-dehydro-3-deoxyphosphogluconate aldolase/(4S)-4-hydroxy-2-oxoglutarate aldolase